MKTLKNLKNNEEPEIIFCEENSKNKNFSSLRQKYEKENDEKKTTKKQKTNILKKQEKIEEIVSEDVVLADETSEELVIESVVENVSEEVEKVQEKDEVLDIYSIIVESVEKNKEKRIYFESDDSSFVIDPNVSKIIKAVYEGLNRDNRKIMRDKLNENLSSFCKIAYFSMCKLGKIDEEIK